MLEALLAMRAPGKARPRAVAGKRPYMPAEYMAAKRTFILLLRATQNGPLRAISGPLRLEATFYYPTDTRPDLDNAVGFLGDSLQDAGVFANDRQIIEIEARIERGPEAIKLRVLSIAR